MVTPRTRPKSAFRPYGKWVAPSEQNGSQPRRTVGPLPEDPAGGGAPPNVLFIFVDDWNGWMGALGAYPGVITPSVDALAQQGTLFTRAYAAGANCNASRASMLTGIRPSTAGVYDNVNIWRNSPALRQAVTLPQHFMANGYETLGGGEIFHFIDPGSWNQSFLCTKNPYPPVVPASGVSGLGILDWAPLDLPDTAMADENVATWAANYLSQTHSRPFFLAVGIVRPHTPLYNPRPYFDMYPLEGVTLPPTNPDDLNDVPPPGVQLARPWGLDAIIAANGFQQQIVQAYLASTTFMDVQVGRVLSALNNGPNAGNTIVVLTSDHGFHLGQKQHWDKYTLWEESTHVPLVIVAPGVTTAGTQCHRTVSLLDLYPTLIELCGLSSQTGLAGESLMPLLLDPAATWDRPVVTTYPRDNHAVRSERWRYIRYNTGHEELYDHDADPFEWTNLASDPSYTQLKSDLASWIPTTSALPVAVPGEKLYVKSDATGLNLGTSWEDAFVSLQDALALAANSQGIVKEIWVAAGRYTPTVPDGDRRLSFIIAKAVRVYGGFNGTETSVAHRNPDLNLTILSGDLNGDDEAGFANREDNSFHVVAGTDNLGVAVFDGFTITGGNADGEPPYDRGGGAFFNWSSGSLVDCHIVDNSAVKGGGVYVSGGAIPRLTRCLIEANRATDSGGGLYDDNYGAFPINCQLNGFSNARPFLTDCIFAGNKAQQSGGAIYNNNSQPRMLQCLFTGNQALDKGGAIYNYWSYMAITNCAFGFNTAGLGGGVYNGLGSSHPVFFNCILWGNSDSSGSGSLAQIRSQTGQPEFYYGCIQGGWGGIGSNNLSGDPRWMDPNGDDDQFGTPDDDYRLSVLSPCLDAGDDNADTDHAASGVQPLPDFDLALQPRQTDSPDTPDTGLGDPPIVDMGPLEGGYSDCNDDGFVDFDDLAFGTSQDCNGNMLPDECDIATGTSADCDADLIPDACAVASGTSPDCNANGLPDLCDIADGTSLDCDGNGTPDSCDVAGGAAPDCNGNGRPDACDLTGGTSRDCNANGVPDTCDIGSGLSLDCNRNTVPDSCDLTGGTSPDCNTNRTPDSCDLSSLNSPDCNLTGRPDECDIAMGISTDADGNGVPDECESGAAPGDCDNDGDVDLEDLLPVVQCLTGPGAGPAGPNCICTDMDDDADVDLFDAAVFLRIAG